MYYISDIIRKLMIDKGVNVTTLAHKMNLLQPTLSRKLQNKTEDYKLSLLSDIIQALNCEIKIDIIDSESNKVIYTIKENEK